MSWVEALLELPWDGEVTRDCPMAPKTSFRIGGPAAVFLDAASVRDVAQAQAFAGRTGTALFVMGNGTNLLVRDEGFDGLIVRVGPRMASVRIQGTCLTAQCGATLRAVSRQAARAGLSGLEFASGIPGTLGGALYMNAGAYGGQMSDCVAWAQVLQDGRVCRWEADRFAFSYRHSALKAGGVALEVCLNLTPGDPQALAARIEQLDAQRREKQPLNLPSAGSAFKRPVGAYAAALIDQCGLKGLRVGGAQVSEKHAGFIVNTGGATAADVLALCEQVRRCVLERTGYALECEFIVL